MRIFPILAIILLTTFGAVKPGLAQQEPVLKSDIVRLLGDLPELSPIREDMEALGFRGEKLDLAVGQITRMLQDPLIANNIAERVIAAQGVSIGTGQPSGLFWPLVDQGLAHLPARDLHYFYRVEHSILKALPERQCGLVIKEKLSPNRQARVTAKVAARLETSVLEEYYRIQFKAAQFGAARAPRQLSAREEARAVENINAALGKALAERPDATALKRAYDDLGKVGNRRACAAGRVFMDAVLSLEARDLHQALVLLSTP